MIFVTWRVLMRVACFAVIFLFTSRCHFNAELHGMHLAETYRAEILSFKVRRFGVPFCIRIEFDDGFISKNAHPLE